MSNNMIMSLANPADRMLFRDYLFKMKNTDEDAFGGWAYNWNDAKCSSSCPMSRDGWSTLFLIMNHTDDPVNDFQTIFYHLNTKKDVTRKGKLKLKLEPDPVHSRRNITIFQNKKDAVTTTTPLVEGYVTSENNPMHMDPNVCNYAMLLSKTVEGQELLRHVHEGAVNGYSAFLDHAVYGCEIGTYDETVGYRPQGGEKVLKLIAMTGLGIDDTSYDTLATRISLVAEDRNPSAQDDDDGSARTYLARCHISYHDASFDPSMGPTIEMIAVQKKYRGQDLLPLLWYWVRCFMEEHFTLECLNADAPPGHVMIKATQLKNCIIERRTLADGKIVTVTDKDFLFRHAGFSVKQQKGYMAHELGAERPKDEEGIMYVPLLSPGELHNRIYDPVLGTEILQSAALMANKSTLWKENWGAMACEACGTISKIMLQCARCKTNYYCNADCQRKDWKNRHKRWCGKTREEVKAMLVAKGFLIS